MNNLPPSVPAQSDKNLSIASLILGILSMFLCSIVAGIPAIITGHMALNRQNATGQSSNKGIAIAGLVMGYISIALLAIMIPVMLSIALPVLAKEKVRAQEAACANNLKQVALAARIYANEHGDKWPTNFLAMSNELTTPKILVCRKDHSHTPAKDWSTFGPNNVSYELLKPADDAANPQTPLFRCPYDGNTAMSDGSVIQQGAAR